MKTVSVLLGSAALAVQSSGAEPPPFDVPARTAAGGMAAPLNAALTAQRAVPTLIRTAGLWPAALWPQQCLRENQRVGRFQAAAAQESRGPTEPPGSWSQCRIPRSSKLSMSPCCAVGEFGLRWQAKRDTALALSGVAEAEAKAPSPLRSAGPLPLSFQSVLKLMSKIRPSSILCAWPKRQRTGAVQDLADFPMAPVNAKRLGVWYFPALCRLIPERVLPIHGPNARPKLEVEAAHENPGRQRLAIAHRGMASPEPELSDRYGTSLSR